MDERYFSCFMVTLSELVVVLWELKYELRQGHLGVQEVLEPMNYSLSVTIVLSWSLPKSDHISYCNQYTFDY